MFRAGEEDVGGVNVAGETDAQAEERVAGRLAAAFRDTVNVGDIHASAIRELLVRETGALTQLIELLV